MLYLELLNLSKGSVGLSSGALQYTANFYPMKTAGTPQFPVPVVFMGYKFAVQGRQPRLLVLGRNFEK